MSVSANAEFRAFAGGGSAKAEFCRNVSVHSYSLFVMVAIRIRLRRITIVRARFTDDAKRLLESNDHVQFLEVYGDQFCSDIEVGGEFVGLLEYFASTESEKRALSANFSAAYGAGSGSIDLSKNLDKLNKKNVLKVVLYRTGVETDFPTQESFIDAATRFPSYVNLSGGAETNVIRSSNSAALGRPQGSRVPNFAIAQSYLDDLIQRKQQAEMILGALLYVIAYPFLFDRVEVGVLRGQIELLNMVLTELDAKANTIISTPAAPEEPQLENEVGDIVLPERLEHIAIPVRMFGIIRDRHGNTSMFSNDSVSKDEYTWSAPVSRGGVLWSVTIAPALDLSDLKLMCEVAALGKKSVIRRSGWRLAREGIGNGILFGLAFQIEGAITSSLTVRYTIETMEGRRITGQDSERVGLWAEKIRWREICSHAITRIGIMITGRTASSIAVSAPLNDEAVDSAWFGLGSRRGGWVSAG